MAPARPSPQQRSDDVEEPDKTDRPSAELDGRDRAPEERQGYRVVGYIGRQVQADERHMEAADKEADCEQPEACVRNASRSASWLLCGCNAPALASAGRSPRSPKARGTIATETAASTNMVECQLSRLLCRIDANGTIANCPNEPPAVAMPRALDRHSTGVCRPIAPRIGPKPAADMPMPASALPAVNMTLSLAIAIMSMPAT